MALITARWSGNGLVTIVPAMQNLESEKARIAYRRAINHTGRKTFTAVKRALSKQVGVSQAQVIKRGALRKKMASNSSLEFSIHANGEYMPLRDFSPTQLKRGVKASPWGQRRLFESTFIVKSLGGHVWKRTSKRRLPIEKLYGPSIPKEMIEGISRQAFFDTIRRGLPPRVEHEIKRLTKGAF